MMMQYVQVLFLKTMLLVLESLRKFGGSHEAKRKPSTLSRTLKGALQPPVCQVPANNHTGQGPGELLSLPLGIHLLSELGLLKATSDAYFQEGMSTMAHDWHPSSQTFAGAALQVNKMP